ncbi:MAG: MarR family transcriptional regulator [Pseudomonadales bacterium]
MNAKVRDAAMVERPASARAAEAAPAYDEMLARRLLHAFYWLDDGLQAHMRREQGFSLPRAQSMMMVCIGDGIDRQSDMAKHLGVSKQAVRQALKELEAKGLVVIEPDPDNGRRKLVRFTPKGEQMRNVARRGLLALEQLLEQRIGAQQLRALRDSLSSDWGPTPE